MRFTGSTGLKNLLQSTPFLHSCDFTVLDPCSFLLHLLKLSIECQSFNLTLQAHAQAHRVGLTHHPFLAQKLISSYSHFNCPSDAQRVVSQSLLLRNNIHICNILLNGLAKNQLFVKCCELFNNMSNLVDEFTFSTMFKCIGDMGDVWYGRMVHAKAVKNGFVSDTVAANSLFSMYGKCSGGSFDDCLKTFDEMPQRNISSWNALISCYVDTGRTCSLLKFVTAMQDEGLKFDSFTFSTLLSMCEGDVNYGRELHCYSLKDGFLDMGSSDNHLSCSLINMYVKNDRVDVARLIFDRLDYRNMYIWTAMINGYVNSGDLEEALFIFREMQWRNALEPNKVSIVSILPACSSFAGLLGGKQIHAFAVRRLLNRETPLCNALIDMYSKSGSLNSAKQVFKGMSRDAISWSCMIYGYSLHGKGEDAVTLFYEMVENGIKPDPITMVGVLSACCRSGLFDEGIRIYESVVSDYLVDPTTEMCACVIDIFSRSGQLDRALEFIKRMPVEPGPSIWGALANAEDSDVRDLAYKFLVEMEPENSSNYVALSNLHAASKKWDVVAKLRTEMKQRGLRKLPGCSWITVGGVTHSFYVLDKSHPCSDLVYAMLDEVVLAMKLSGWNPDSAPLMDMMD